MSEIKVTLPGGPALIALKREAERRQMPVETLVIEMLHQWRREATGENRTLQRIAEVNNTPPRQ
jgi:hypothetical protein